MQLKEIIKHNVNIKLKSTIICDVVCLFIIFSALVEQINRCLFCLFIVVFLWEDFLGRRSEM